MGVVQCGNSEEYAKIRKGVRRMCTLSPYIFNLCVQDAINRVKGEITICIGRPDSDGGRKGEFLPGPKICNYSIS